MGVKSTACVASLENMRTIGGEADGLKPEAVVGIKETTEGGGHGKTPARPPIPSLSRTPFQRVEGILCIILWIYVTYQSGKDHIENI